MKSENDSLTAREFQVAALRKRAYVPPQVQKLGSVAELTLRANGGTRIDTGGRVHKPG